VRRLVRHLPSPVQGIALALVLLLALVPAVGARADEIDRDLEPPPPWVFFDQPEEQTAREIDDLVSRFTDQAAVISGRAGLVHRYGVLSVPRLVSVLTAEDREPRNESRTWNAALTAYALRNTIGNARELWPLLTPMIVLLDESAEPYRRAFCALALGAFRGPTFAPPLPRRPDPLMRRIPEEEARRNLDEAVAALGRHALHGHPHVRVAVALALGKSGARNARELLQPEARLRGAAKDAVVEPRQAVLIAVGLLPGQDDESLLVEALKDGERPIRRAAALAVAVQALHDHPPGWTNAPERMLRALKNDQIRPHLEDGAEAVFARGILAATGLAPGEWRKLFDLAKVPSTEEDAAASAAQCLLFCDEPWFLGRAVTSVTEGVDLKPTVLAMMLLRIGEQATEEGIGICEKLLSNKAARPRGEPEWDVRYFAVVGLLRALAAGRVADETRRALVLEALDQGLKRGLLKGPFRTELERVMNQERRQLTENVHYALPESRVFDVEGSFDDPYGLFARDLRDMAVVRLNGIVPIVFNVNELKPGPPGERDVSEAPRKFLRSCHRHFPYFTRLDLRATRGLRPEVTMPRGQDPNEEVDR
jgi:hypothetical protein